MEIVRLQGQLFGGIGNPHRSPSVVGQKSIAGWVHSRRSGGGVEDRHGARLCRGSVVAYAGIDRCAIRGLKNEVPVVPATVAFVVLQKLVVTDAGTREHPEIDAELIGIDQVTSVLKEDRIGALVICAEGRTDGVVARVAEAN